MVFDFNKLGLWQLVFHLICSVVLTDAMIPGLPGANQKTWTYEVKSMEAHSADESILKFDISIERVSRGVYAISGSVTLNVDVYEDHPCDIEGGAFRSNNGVNDYKILPFKVPRQHIITAMNTFYKDMLMDSLSECSNLPVFDDKFEPPLRKGVYSLEKCQFSQDGFPNHMSEGFYKTEMFGNGYVDWSLTVVVQVEYVH
ncbi:uncharacterized protein [Musca autumnalis]|uniref:uncharacterized protein n=1 Tax=Musca autumnalis TaxID=221902 RepID=UPI003CE798B7